MDGRGFTGKREIIHAHHSFLYERRFLTGLSNTYVGRVDERDALLLQHEARVVGGVSRVGGVLQLARLVGDVEHVLILGVPACVGTV